MRRRLLVGVLACVLFTAWAAVPGGFAANYGSQQTVVIADGSLSDAVTMDPNLAYERSSTVPDHQMYSTLVTFARGNLTQVQPQVAQSWDVSKDARTYTFHLKHGVVFSSGNPLTADDVVYSIQRVVNLPKNPASWLITQMGIDDKTVSATVKAPDPYTVVIALPKPFSPGAFLSILANPVASIVDSKTVKAHVQNNDWGNAWLNDHSAGSGPFVLVKWERSVSIELGPNPTYNLGAVPSIKRIVLLNIAENTVQREMLGRGDADIAWDLSASQIAALRREPKFFVFQTPDLAMEYLGMDVKNVAAFGKAGVRQAVKYAIDYDGIIKDLLTGNGTPLQGVIPKGLFGYEPSLPFKHDPARAKSLLAEAGFGNGFTAELLIGTAVQAGGISGADLAAKIKNDLGAVGIRINVRQIVGSEMLKTYRAQQAQMVMLTWFVDYPDADDFAKPFGDYTQKSLAWRLNYANDPLSKLVGQAAEMQNTPERAAIYKKVNETMAQDGPFAILYQPLVSLGVSKRIQNFLYDPVNFYDFLVMTKQ
ncbi:MAG TPA: ABC transporter substrate-binding protein [bacterium]|nr:ABC transporter substrate-binding protein [bacterium]